MKRVLILVEGQTEETFVRDLLEPHLSRRGVFPVPILAKTKRTPSGQTFKGGIPSYQKVRRDLLRLLGDTGAILVTTMIDYYGLPEDFPGKDSLPGGSPYERVAHLEKAFRDDIGHPRFLPFLVLHEFEALLFAQPQEIANQFPGHRGVQELLREVGSSNPEEINDGPDTHPSARIRRYLRGYRKRHHGPLIAARIGLERIRSRCPHFDAWVRKLEGLREEEP